MEAVAKKSPKTVMLEVVDASVQDSAHIHIIQEVKEIGKPIQVPTNIYT